MRQVALADYILITKLDLIELARTDAAEKALTERRHQLNPAAVISRIDGPDFKIEALLRASLDPTTPKGNVRAWLNVEAYGKQNGHGHHHKHDEHSHDHEHRHRDHGLHDGDIASFCLIREQPIPLEALRLLLDTIQQNLGPNLLRVKGIIHVAEEADRPAIIQGAQHLLHNLAWLDRWPDDDRRSKIIFITQHFERAEVESMIELIDRVSARTAAARARAQSA